MLTRLYWMAVAYTTLGLLAGLGYRELTKAHDFTGKTQLSVLHTHLLALGLLMALILLALEHTLRLSRDNRFWTAVVVYNVGVLLSSIMMTIIGTQQVLRAGWQTPASIAGIAGLGHITLTLGLVLLLMSLKKAVNRAEADRAETGELTAPGT